MKTASLLAGTFSSLGSGLSISEHEFALREQNNNIAKPIAQYLIGNRCGHSKNDPKFFPSHKKIDSFPRIIQKAHNFLELSYFDLKKLWRSLNFLDGQQKRSERREACIMVGQFLNTYNNLKNFTVDYTIKDIAYKIRISLSRVKQALKDLTKAGYLKTTHFVKSCFKGSWYGIKAIRKITDKFYLELGISEHALNSARCWKSGHKMDDTRNNKFNGGFMKKIGDYIKPQETVYSSVNNKPFYQSNDEPLYMQSTADTVQSNTLSEDISHYLILKAKEESKETNEPWFKIYRRLEMQYKTNQAFPLT